MSLVYVQLCKGFSKYKDSFLEISNPLEKNTIFKLEIKAIFLEMCISF